MLGDRGFCSYAALARLSQRGIDSVMRLHQARQVSFREGQRLGRDDRLMTWQKPAQRTDAWSLEEWAALPESLSLRLIRLAVSTPGFRTRSVTLVTTLTDANAYPAERFERSMGSVGKSSCIFTRSKSCSGWTFCAAKARNLLKRKP